MFGGGGLRRSESGKNHPLKAKRYYQKSRLITFLFRFTATLIACLIPLLLIDAKIRPIVKTSASAVMNAGITRIINNTVIDTLSATGTEYSEIVDISYAPDGSITHLTLNNVNANILKSIVANSINETVAEDGIRIMNIPWGTLTGREILSGRGRSIQLKITEFSYALVDIRSEFSSAGINQTRHSIILDVTVKAHGYIAITHISTQVKTSLIIAETIIIGSVPDTYFNYQKSND